ncbi:MAG TPA: hypothetical protein VHP38_12130 [Ruminiclostridium sp.]|nr:hypothetical protein [Ruminiclostridium sp.]
MKEQIETRIKELKMELESGNKAMEELEAKRTSILYTLLRINGAVQVLEELAKKEESSGSNE